MSEQSSIRPEDMETAMQVLMTIGKVQIDEWPDDSVDLYRGAWLALDKSGVEASDVMLRIIGTAHYRICEDESITPESIEKKCGRILKWSEDDFYQYRRSYYARMEDAASGYFG